MSDFFSSTLFAQTIREQNETVPYELIALNETGSTSTHLLSLLSKGAPVGTTVVAQTQTSGRGRSGNQWYSQSTQNLYISTSIRIQGNIAKRLPLVPLAAGVAAVESLAKECIENVCLKWPNDLLRQKKKVGGILCETPGIENDSAVAVVGMGLNLGSQSFPSELKPIADTLHPTNIQNGLREKISARWVRGLYNWCKAIQEEQEKLLISRWKQLAEPFGRRVKVGELVGTTVNLNGAGRLLIKQENGEICSIPGGIVEALD